SLAASQPTGQKAKDAAFWKETPMDGVVQEFQTKCAQRNDHASCLKFKVLNLLDEMFRRDSFKVSDAVALIRNSFNPEHQTTPSEDRSVDDEVLNEVGHFVQGHDLLVTLPGATLNLSPRHLDHDEVTISLKFSQEQGRASTVDEGRRSKLKKIFVPILVFLLLKVVTLVPLFIGALGLKAWNALQLSFFSFVISVALAIFQLCKKIAADASPPQVVAHGPWDSNPTQYSAARNLNSHTLAYRSHNQAE
ncbi:hypothetical protein L798_11594, partial [Zootermopsis nevadensis]